ncbi:chemotaxis protein CheC [Halobacillus locisalis]|uniref:Chemotaxis protein CheC n=1 Tax=Halobacillus locisalis TaxID=220753 RepID=A0A838CQH8_9BACI|nr:chemotaxis protein CheC [Halobacillus locisalis]MBA2174089.1 chemotaxis protein CheC [Halobacillus locisalis]
MSFEERLTAIHLDVLKEIGNIGAAHAATSLSKLLDRKVDMHVPAVRLVEFDEVMELAGGAENEVVSVFLRIEGEAPGSIFFILSPEQAELFISQMTGIPSSIYDGSDELAISALQELGNILSGSYLTALSDFTNLDIYPSVPSLSLDMVGAILSFGLIELSQVSDQAIVIETSLTDCSDDKSAPIEGHFFLFPDPQSYLPLFKSLGVSSYE